MTLELALREYLKEIEIRKYTPKTIKGYRNNLSLFVRYCSLNSIENTEDLDYSSVKGFSQALQQKGNKGTYINSLLKVIKSFITYIYGEGYGGFDTKSKFTWCKEEKPVIRAFKPQDVKAMLDSCAGRGFMPSRDRCILTMLFETGIRCWELCCIKTTDIYDDFIIINGKNHKQRVVPITPMLHKAMIKYELCREAYTTLHPCDYYFISFHSRQLNNSAVENVVKRHGEYIEGVRVSPHTCRHFFAQQQVKMGTDLYTISRLLGHENIKITQTYLDSLRDEDVIAIAKSKSVLANL